MNATSPIHQIKLNWAATLKKSRIVQNLTVRELSVQTNVSEDTISRLENGKSVSVDAFLNIAVFLGHAPDLLNIMKSPKVKTIEQHQALGKGKLDGRSRVRHT